MCSSHNNNSNNNNLHLYSANLYMNIFGCTLQYCYIKVMLKVTKAGETIKNYNKKQILRVSCIFMYFLMNSTTDRRIPYVFKS